MKFLLRISGRLFLQILLLLLCYFVSRAVFTAVNAAYFPPISIPSFLELAFYGTRFDVSAILLTNALYFFLFLLPLPLWRMPGWERFTQKVFIVVNAIVFLFEFSDWAYFPFNHKRSTSDVLNMITRKGDFLGQLPTFLVDYWFVPVAWLLLTGVIIGANRYIRKLTPLSAPLLSSRPLVVVGQVSQMFLFVAFMVIGIRGGLQLKPIVLTDAMKYSDNEFAPVVLNTPFSIINSLNNSRLPDVNYMTGTELKTYIDPVKHYKSRPFNRTNVVVIILESFSKEFTCLGKGASCTPFLDSLMGISLNCTNAYANALRSAEGIPAIIAGIPSLMEEPVTTSMYGNNKISALPNLLKLNGYSSAFYHGGTNGTMNFDLFCANAGYDKYYGRDEYKNENDYDGNWGIWDEPFLQYFAEGLGKTQQPFIGTVFTVSSHPPYRIPKQYESAIVKGTAVERVVRYSDMALRKFFETASRQSWYNNTLFVITADHISMHRDKKLAYRDYMGLYAIPIIFYAPGDTLLRGQVKEPVQQIDILPTVLDYTGYDKPFFALGNSVLSPGDRFVINAINNNYRYYKEGYLLMTTELSAKYLFAYPTDAGYTVNLLKSHVPVAQNRLRYLKSFVQVYNNAMNKNQMWVPVPGR